ncbi:uncharacterized protein (DUF2336 family) [Aminobacter lissarensis]|uniref:Uncharacterized protein (DUF2336 family) n=1 Tax=Aminobacter carboxidus TaxID=376165 RepID=A0A8E1WEN2_9HYPH|nr:DUF2336 domain-containing protein [Aminobacter lissarensis]MBB6466893.1 uncharacterized protein (DUF2336 family) [Aminobacter lissarensis]
MSASDFRQIAIGRETGKPERLFRAAVSAFCALPRPSRREIGQLEDLTLPLFDKVSVEARRYVAAALSESEYAPFGLVRKLCDEPVDIAAPLLVRSPILSDVTLISLIGRHGLPHARAIARRPNLHKTIADLIRVLERPRLVYPEGAKQDEPATVASQASVTVAPDVSNDPVPGALAENVRRKLRAMMTPAAPRQTVADEERAPSYDKLKATALTGNDTFFQTALADALEIDLHAARSITEKSGYSSLIDALKALDLTEEQAFLLAASILPGQFAHAESVRLFLERYHALHRDVALDRVRDWKAASVGARIRSNAERLQPRPRSSAAKSEQLKAS